jgi:hypothetical protein
MSCSMERQARKDRGRYLVELVSMRKGDFHCWALPYIEFIDEAVPCFGEPSRAFDFAESPLSRPMTRLYRTLKDESSLMAFASTLDPPI